MHGQRRRLLRIGYLAATQAAASHVSAHIFALARCRPVQHAACSPEIGHQLRARLQCFNLHTPTLLPPLYSLTPHLAAASRRSPAAHPTTSSEQEANSSGIGGAAAVVQQRQ